MKELDKLLFNKALKENTMESYNAYISEFPDGEYILVAKNKRDLAQYDKYVNEGNIADLVYYVRNNNISDKNYKVVLDKLRLKKQCNTTPFLLCRYWIVLVQMLNIYVDLRRNMYQIIPLLQ